MATKKKATKALAKIENAGQLATVDFGEHAGAGQQSMGAADQAIPYLSIVQASSKVITDPTKKVEGAEIGMIMDSVTKKTYNCANGDGMIFLPCVSSGQLWVEWDGPKGKGKPVNRLQPNDPIVVEAKRKYGFNEWKTSKGNRLEPTFYVSGMILDDDMNPAGFGIISFKSTGTKPYQESIGELYKIPGQAPLYAFPLRIKTKAETRDAGTSYNFVIMPNGYDGSVFLDGIAGAFIHPTSDLAAKLWPLASKFAGDLESGAVEAHAEGEASGGGGGTATEDEPY